MPSITKGLIKTLANIGEDVLTMKKDEELILKFKDEEITLKRIK